MVQFTRLSPILLAIGYDFSDYIIGGLAQLARALAWHARGHRFDSDILHTFYCSVTMMVTHQRTMTEHEIFDILNTQHEVLMMCVNDVNEFTRLRVYEAHNTPK